VKRPDDDDDDDVFLKKKKNYKKDVTKSNPTQKCRPAEGTNWCCLLNNHTHKFFHTSQND
jgi:hypothetical protein